MAGDVFIAYSRKDSHAAEAIETRLHEAGLECYRDVRSIPGSEEWMREIATALKGAHAVVVLVSRDSAASEHVSSELTIAFNARRLFVPVQLEREVELSDTMTYCFGRCHFVYALPSVEAALPAIENATWHAVDRSRHKGAFQDGEDLKKKSNYTREISFAEDRCGLYVGDSGGGVASVEDGAYVLAAKPTDYLGFEMSALPKLTDFILEATISKVHGPDDQWLGFEWGGRYPEDYYQFLLNGQGAVRIAKHYGQRWYDLACNYDVRHVQRGNVRNSLRVVRKDSAFHLFINGRHSLTAQDTDIRLGRIGMVVGQGVRAAFTDVHLTGVDLDAVFRTAADHWSKLEVPEARELFRYVQERRPSYRHLGWGVSVAHLLWETRPDRRKSILIVVGSGILPQIHDGAAAARLRDQINRRGRPEDFEFACVVTDTGLLEDSTFLQCPVISIGGPVSNKVTAAITDQLTPDPAGAEWVKILHRMSEADRRVALWGGTAEETTRAVDLFISSALLEQFLSMLWGQKKHPHPSESRGPHATKSPFSAEELEVLRFVRGKPHRVSLAKLSQGTSLSLSQTREAIRSLRERGYVVQDDRDNVPWDQEKATFFTEPTKRDEIDSHLYPGGENSLPRA